MLIIYTKKLKFIRMIKNYKINEKFIRQFKLKEKKHDKEIK